MQQVPDDADVPDANAAKRLQDNNGNTAFARAFPSLRC